MAACIIDELAIRWATEPGLDGRAQSWRWFIQAFAQSLQHEAGTPAAPWAIDDKALAQAFFSWAESADNHAPYAALDGADFRHFVMGLLLQQLLQANPPVLRNASIAQMGAPVTRFVLTLLQALHLNAGSAPLKLDGASLAGARWASFLENVAEDASNATCFLDQMTGLPPMWQSRTLIEHRPAMQKALARDRQPS